MATSVPPSLPQLRSQPQQQQRPYRRQHYQQQHEGSSTQRRWQAMGRGRLRRLHAAEAALKECEWDAVAVPPARGFAAVGGLLHFSTLCVDCEDAIQSLQQIIESTCCCAECSNSSNCCCASSNNGSVWASPFNSPTLAPEIPCHDDAVAGSPVLAPGSPGLPVSAAAAAAAPGEAEVDEEKACGCSSPLRLMRRNLARLVSDGVPAQLLLIRFVQKEQQQEAAPVPLSPDGAPTGVPGNAEGAAAANGSTSDCDASDVSPSSNTLLLQLHARRTPSDERQPVAVLPLDGRDAAVAAAAERCSCCSCSTKCRLGGAGEQRPESEVGKSTRKSSIGGSSSNCTCARWCSLSSCGSVYARIDCGGTFRELLCCLLLLPIVEYRMRCSTEPEEWEALSAGGACGSSRSMNRRSSSSAIGGSCATSGVSGAGVAALCDARVAPSFRVFLGSVVGTLHEYFYRAALRQGDPAAGPPQQQTNHLAPAAVLAEAMLARDNSRAPRKLTELKSPQHQQAAQGNGVRQGETDATPFIEKLQQEDQQQGDQKEQTSALSDLRGDSELQQEQQEQPPQQQPREEQLADVRQLPKASRDSSRANGSHTSSGEPEGTDLSAPRGAQIRTGAGPGLPMRVAVFPPHLLQLPTPLPAARIRRASTGELALRRKRRQQQRGDRNSLQMMMMLQQLPNGALPSHQQQQQQQGEQQGEGGKQREQSEEQRGDSGDKGLSGEQGRYGEPTAYFYWQQQPHADPQLQHVLWRHQLWQQQMWQQQMWQQQPWLHPFWQHQDLMRQHQWQQHQQHQQHHQERHRQARNVTPPGTASASHEASQRAAAAAAAAMHHRQLQHIYMQQLHQYQQQQHLRAATGLHESPDDPSLADFPPFLPVWVPHCALFQQAHGEVPHVQQQLHQQYVLPTPEQQQQHQHQHQQQQQQQQQQHYVGRGAAASFVQPEMNRQGPRFPPSEHSTGGRPETAAASGAGACAAPSAPAACSQRSPGVPDGRDAEEKIDSLPRPLSTREGDLEGDASEVTAHPPAASQPQQQALQAHHLAATDNPYEADKSLTSSRIGRSNADLEKQKPQQQQQQQQQWSENSSNRGTHDATNRQREHKWQHQMRKAPQQRRGKRPDNETSLQEQPDTTLVHQQEEQASRESANARYRGHSQDTSDSSLAQDGRPMEAASDGFTGPADDRRMPQQQQQWYSGPYPREQQMPHVAGPHQMYPHMLHPHMLLHMQQQAAAAAAAAHAAAAAGPQNLGYVPGTYMPSTAGGWVPAPHTAGMLMYQQQLMQMQQQLATAAADQQAMQPRAPADEGQNSHQEQQQQDTRMYGHPQQNRWHWNGRRQPQQWGTQPYMFLVPGMGLSLHFPDQAAHPREQHQHHRSDEQRDGLHPAAAVGGRGSRAACSISPGNPPAAAPAAGGSAAANPSPFGLSRRERGRLQRRSDREADARSYSTLQQLHQQLYEQQLAAAELLGPWPAPFVYESQGRQRSRRDTDTSGPYGEGAYRPGFRGQQERPMSGSSNLTLPPHAHFRAQRHHEQGAFPRPPPDGHAGGFPSGVRAASDCGEWTFQSLPYASHAGRPYQGGFPWGPPGECQLPLDDYWEAQARGGTHAHHYQHQQQHQQRRQQQRYLRVQSPVSDSRCSSGGNQRHPTSEPSMRDPSSPLRTSFQQAGNRYREASRAESDAGIPAQRLPGASPNQRAGRARAGTPCCSSTDGEGGGGLSNSVCFEQHPNHSQFPGSPAAESAHVTEVSQGPAPEIHTAPASPKTPAQPRAPAGAAASGAASGRGHSAAGFQESACSDSSSAVSSERSCGNTGTPGVPMLATAPGAAAASPVPTREFVGQSSPRISIEGNNAGLGSPEDGDACLRGLSRGEFNLKSFLVATTPAVRLPKERQGWQANGRCSGDPRSADGKMADVSRADGKAEEKTGEETERDQNLPNFLLSELWRSFDDASIFGLEVPLLDEEHRPTYVVYVPYLSALHLFPQKKQQQQKGNTSNCSATSSSSSGCFRFMEVRLPYQRRPLYQQVSQMLQGAEVTQSQQLQLLVCSSEELSDDSWLCIYWQAIQREFCKVPAPSFLVYYRLRFTSSPQTPPNIDESTAHDATEPKTAVERESPIGTSDGDATPANEGERFIALVRFAVIASKGHQEWLSSGNDDRSQFFRGEMRRLEEWLQRLQVNHPDFNTFKMGANRR